MVYSSWGTVAARNCLPSYRQWLAGVGVESESVSHSVIWLFATHGLQPVRLLCLWSSPGKNTGVGSPSFLQGNLPNPGIKPRSPALKADSLPLHHQWYRDTKPAFSWGQVFRVIPAPELPAALRAHFWFCSILVLLTSLEVYSWEHLSSTTWLLRLFSGNSLWNTYSLTCTSGVWFCRRQLKNHSVLGGNDTVGLFLLLWLFLMASFLVFLIWNICIQPEDLCWKHVVVVAKSVRD